MDMMNSKALGYTRGDWEETGVIHVCMAIERHIVSGWRGMSGTNAIGYPLHQWTIICCPSRLSQLSFPHLKLSLQHFALSSSLTAPSSGKSLSFFGKFHILCPHWKLFFQHLEHQFRLSTGRKPSNRYQCHMHCTSGHYE